MMKSKLQLIISAMLLFSNILISQSNYSFSVSDILASMPNGLRMPDGTIAKAKKIKTGAGNYATDHGQPGPDVGGMLDNSPPNATSTSNCQTIGAYNSTKMPTKFSKLSGPNLLIQSGEFENATSSIGFRIYFDRPTIYSNFLIMDLDGWNDGSGIGSAEWVTSFGFNSNTFITASNTKSTASEITSELENATVTIDANHSWKSLITSELNATAASNLPATYTIVKQGELDSGESDPDEIQNQVVFNPLSAVTDFFVLWGIWKTDVDPFTQSSGVSPITVTVSPDFGDAPNSYKTLLTSGGPSHGITDNLKFGSTITTEADGLPSTNANNSTDDDGILFVAPIPNNGNPTQVISNFSLTTNFTNFTGQIANFVAWIDWNNNQSFEANEGVTAFTPSSLTSGNVTFQWNGFTLTGAIGLANTYVRIRVTTEPISTSNVGGAFKNGEVEDYKVLFTSPFPLELINFNGKHENSITKLLWNTENEKNVLRFEIQRSLDGKIFGNIGTQKAGNSIANNYQFSDMKPTSILNYYRLQIIENDGNYHYSKIILIENEEVEKLSVKVFPNPIRDDIELKVEHADKIEINIYNAVGQLVWSQPQGIIVKNSFKIDFSNYPSGIYYLNANTDDGQFIHTKLIK